MSTSTAKRLILYRFDRPPAEALVRSDAFLLPSGIEYLSPDGVQQVVDYKQVKALCFGAQGAPADLFLEQNTFDRRPKAPGLWTSFQLLDGDILEGVLPHNLLEWPKQGYWLIPPRAGTYRQRVFLPREAVRETIVRGMVGKPAGPSQKPRSTPAAEATRQMSMFD